jgi:CubicO group peptidase (beta-lactamase class C family)
MHASSDFRLTRLFAAAALATVLAACGREEPREAAPTLDGPAAEAPAETISPLDPEALARIDAELARLAQAGERSGYVMAIAVDGRVEHVSEAGWADVERRTPMTADTVMRVASMTKPVTAVAILILAEDGALALDDKVADYIPAFADTRVATSVSRNEDFEIPTEPLARPITIEDLLTHTSGLGYVFDYETNLGALYLERNVYEDRTLTLAESNAALAGLPLYSQPGERWHYSWSSDVLGSVIEETSGMAVEDFVQARIFGPLGMDSTTFFPSRNPAIMERVATLYTHGEDGALAPVDPRADFVLDVTAEAGGAGLFSTVNDYMRFAQMLADRGELDGARVLSPESVAAMTTVHVGPDRMPGDMNRQNLGFGYSIGVTYEGEGPAPAGLPGDFGWGGYFDTNFTVSPSTGVVAVIMAQEQPGPGTAGTTGARQVFGPMLSEALGGG